MITKRRVDRVGGVGSILVGMACAWIGWGDWRAEHSLWKVFAAMCVVLVLNGVAMIRYSLRPERAGDAMDDSSDGARGSRGAVVRGSSRV